jgi:hypothetical protein
MKRLLMAGLLAVAVAAAPTAHADLSEDWVAAVCKAGTFANGHHYPSARDGALCVSPLRVNISIGEYTTNFEMQNDLAFNKNRPYAWKKNGDTYVLFLAMGDASLNPAAAAALSPLTKYDFQMATT